MFPIVEALNQRQKLLIDISRKIYDRSSAREARIEQIVSEVKTQQQTIA